MITKSNKHKLSLNQDKPKEKGGCTLVAPYALMRSLILDSQISITPLSLCSPLHSKVFPQLNKWAKGRNWSSSRSINVPTQKHKHWSQNPSVCEVLDHDLRVRPSQMEQHVHYVKKSRHNDPMLQQGPTPCLGLVRSSKSHSV
jgi:hypothetical protein